MTTTDKNFRGLGKGLESLLNPQNSVNTATSFITDSSDDSAPSNLLPISQLSSGRFQPREHFSDDSLNSLAESIKNQGLIQPIIVRKLDHPGRYEIIAGERRWRAARKAGLEKIPVLIRNDIENKEAMAIALIENIQREDLNAIEEAQGLQRLNKEFDLTHEEISRIVGRSRSAITNALRLLELEQEIQVMVREDKLKMGHVRALLSLNAKEQINIAKKICEQNLTTREVEKLVQNILQKAPQPISKKRVISKQQRTLFLNLQQRLTEILNSPVKIKYKSDGQGDITIRFNSVGEIEKIISTLQKNNLHD